MRLDRIALFLLAITLFSPSALAQEPEHGAHSHDVGADVLGSVAFPNSGKAAAQKPFITGLALIHSFEYPRAREAFRQAEKADPDLALVYWMQALTNTQLIWGIDDTLSAREDLERLGPSPQARLARARTPRERALGAAVEAFYSPGSPEDRARAFADSMRSWVRRTPADNEARSFAALAIVWQAFFRRGEEAGALNAEAARHAQYVFDRNPRHPGATHYLIHATDAPANAKLGLKAALAYSRIAPGSNHAHHMPSHIFLPLGMWDELVASNERSWKLGRGDDPREADFHSLNWLQYGYLQQGRWKEARALIDTARKITDGASIDPALYPDGALAVEQLSFRYASETGDWSAFVPASRVADLLKHGISQRAQTMGNNSLYQRGVAAVRRGDTTTAVNAIGILEKTRPPLARLLEFELRSRQSTDLERITALEQLRGEMRVDRYVSMTPSPVLDVDEQLGEALVAAKRPKEAIAVYREALNDRPGRAASLLWLARAQAAAGDAAGARATYAELSKVWSKADSDVRAFLKQFR